MSRCLRQIHDFAGGIRSLFLHTGPQKEPGIIYAVIFLTYSTLEKAKIHDETLWTKNKA